VVKWFRIWIPKLLIRNNYRTYAIAPKVLSQRQITFLWRSGMCLAMYKKMLLTLSLNPYWSGHWMTQGIFVQATNTNNNSKSKHQRWFPGQEVARAKILLPPMVCWKKQDEVSRVLIYFALMLREDEIECHIYRLVLCAVTNVTGFYLGKVKLAKRKHWAARVVPNSLYLVCGPPLRKGKRPKAAHNWLPCG